MIGIDVGQVHGFGHLLIYIYAVIAYFQLAASISINFSRFDIVFKPDEN